MSAIVSWSGPPVKVLANSVFGSNLVEASIFPFEQKVQFKSANKTVSLGALRGSGR